MTSNASTPRTDTARFSLRALLIFASTVAVVFTFVGLIVRSHEEAVARELREEKENRIALALVLTQFTDFQTKFGRIPKDLGELEEFTKAPMPKLKKFGRELELRYHPEQHLLVYPCAVDGWSDWVYDSRNPKAGWVEHDW